MRKSANILSPTLRWALFGALALAMLPGVARAADTTPPVIKHTPVKTAVRGESLIITAHMKDESEIFGATLWYRPVGTTTFQSAEMIRKTEDVWGAAISVTTDVEYWIEAYDEFGNGPSRAGSPAKPFHVKLTEPAPIYAMPKPEAPEAAPTAPQEPITIPLASSTKEVITAPAPAPEPAATPEPAPSPAIAEAAPTEKAATPAEPTPAPAARPKSDDSMDDLSAAPKSFAAVQHPTVENSIDEAALAPAQPRDETPVYKTWWFITGVSAVGVAAIVTTIVLLQPQPVYRNVFGATLQPQ